MERRKIYGTIIGIVCFVILMLGVTYAYFYWASNPTDKTNVNLTVTKGLEGAIVYKQGVSVLETAGVSLEPSDSYTDGLNATIEFWKRPSFTNPIYGRISFEMLKLQSVFGNTNSNIGKTDTIKWVVTSYTSENADETVVSEGTFNGKTEGETFSLIEDIELNPFQTFYKIYVWYDASAGNPDLPIGGELLSVEISASATDIKSYYGASSQAVLASLGLEDDLKTVVPSFNVFSPSVTSYSQDIKISQDVSDNSMSSTISGNRTFGTGVRFDSKTGDYTLTGVQTSQSYNLNSIDKYTCNSVLTTCDTIYKIIEVNVSPSNTNYSEAAWVGYSPDLTSNSNKAVSTSYTFDGTTGKYTLSGNVYTNVSYSGSYNEGSNSEYYTCITSSTSCSVLYKYTLANVSGTTILDSQRKQTVQNFNYVTKADIYTSKVSGFSQADVGILTGEDDFGTTYYFRGNVENNYVKFGKKNTYTYNNYEAEFFDSLDACQAEKLINCSCPEDRGGVCFGYRLAYELSSLEECEQAILDGYCETVLVDSEDIYWRIIRINGDGSVRMIYDGTQAYANGVVSSDRQLDDVYFKDESCDDVYCAGYMYSIEEPDDFYGNFVGHEYDSAIKMYIDNWYDINLSEYEKYIELNAGFCVDRSYFFESLDVDDAYRDSYRFYSLERINGIGNGGVVVPTFMCEDQKDTGLFTHVNATSGNKALRNPIGLISTDEIVFAGGILNNGPYGFNKKFSNNSFYLYTGYSYWTITPFYSATEYLYSTHEKVQSDFNIGILTNYGDINVGTSYSALGVKPVINLKADAIKSGTGTMNDPFKVTY